MKRKKSVPRLQNVLIRDLLKQKEESIIKEKLREREREWDRSSRLPKLSQKRSLQALVPVQSSIVKIQPGSAYYQGD